MMRTLLLWVFVGVLVRPAWADDLPDVKSRSAIVIDAENGAEIFAKDADEIRAIASTTKIFVAMAVRKKGLDLDGWTTITKADARYARGGARTRLDVGDTFRNHDLLRAMLMASDNRAPTALGRAAGMTPDELVAAMNAIAKDLHLKRTKFTDPNGLRGNVSTAREMAIALRAALEDDVLRAIMSDDFELVVAKDGRPKIAYGTTNQPLVAQEVRRDRRQDRLHRGRGLLLHHRGEVRRARGRDGVPRRRRQADPVRRLQPGRRLGRPRRARRQGQGRRAGTPAAQGRRRAARTRREAVTSRR